jgi:hypothetical protein
VSNRNGGKTNYKRATSGPKRSNLTRTRKVADKRYNDCIVIASGVENSPWVGHGEFPSVLSRCADHHKRNLTVLKPGPTWKEKFACFDSFHRIHLRRPSSNVDCSHGNSHRSLHCCDSYCCRCGSRLHYFVRPHLRRPPRLSRTQVNGQKVKSESGQ